MERKDYLVEELSREENSYLKRIVMTAKDKYMERNYVHINNTILGIDNMIILEESVLDEILQKCVEEIKSAVEFEKSLLNPKLKDIVNTLSLNEKRILFYLHKQNMPIKEIKSLMNIDRGTVRRLRDRAYKTIAQNLIKGDF